ncbi:MAG: hypothetical protein ABI718_16950 [Acidobacteriota bacterium]
MRVKGARSAVFTLLAIICVSAFAAAQDSKPSEPKFRTSVQVTAIEITVKVTDDSGKTPRDLKSEDFTVLEDGKSRPVIGVEQLSPGVVPAIDKSDSPVDSQLKGQSRWEIVIFIDQTLSSIDSIRIAAKKLHEQVSQLVGSGTVEVVSSDPSPKTILLPTRDPAAVGTAL